MAAPATAPAATWERWSTHLETTVTVDLPTTGVSLRLAQDPNSGNLGLTVWDASIVLAAWERGLGCVINGQGIMQSSVVREHARIPDEQNIMICIALGYPDEDFVANHVKSVREDSQNFVTYLGFDAPVQDGTI